MRFELLSRQHLSQLIAFEYQNRKWFETYIESRGEGFYTHDSIQAHLLEFIDAYKSGNLLPAVITMEQRIVGRANLKDICVKSKTAEVGYRVAKSEIGSGVASFGLKELIKISKQKLGLVLLKAVVMENNPASAKVLEKQGFIQSKEISGFYNFHGNNLSCAEYQLSL